MTEEEFLMDNEFPVLEFNANDRCDGCGAQAYVLATHQDHSDLLFCAHHYRDSKDNLLDEGWSLVEDYEGISQLAQEARV